MPDQHPQNDTPVRLDTRLWAARSSKTRRLASEAINGGHVHLNGQRSKPSHPVRQGDELRIRKGIQTFDIQVSALSNRRGSASEAQTLYIEYAQSQQRRETERLQRRFHKLANPHPTRRPDKRQRRLLRAWQDQT